MEDDRPTAHHAGGSDDEEDDGEDAPDWRMLSKIIKASVARGKGGEGAGGAFVPKRGEKDFAPIVGDSAAADEGSSSLAEAEGKPGEEKMGVLKVHQASLLAASREALFAALTAALPRSHSSKHHNAFLWVPEEQRAYCLNGVNVYGNHFSTLGNYNAERKAVELLPEEALYLFERGTVELWKDNGEGGKVPMTVQQGWSELISDELTLAHFEIYAYLKRLGYVLIRPSTFNRLHTPSPNALLSGQWSIGRWIAQLWSSLVRSGPAQVVLRATRKLRAGEGVRQSLLSGGRWASYDKIFSQLQIVPTGHDKPMLPAAPPRSPYDQAAFFVYKPSTSYKKTKPPEPDFKIVVINARTTTMPTLLELSTLFATAPLPPPAPPRAPRPPRQFPARPSSQPAKPHTLVQRILPWFQSHGLFLTARQKHNKKLQQLRKKPSPYPPLKLGRRGVILAVVDEGVTSFLRFSEAEFAKVPWLGEPRAE